MDYQTFRNIIREAVGYFLPHPKYSNLAYATEPYPNFYCSDSSELGDLEFNIVFMSGNNHKRSKGNTNRHDTSSNIRVHINGGNDIVVDTRKKPKDTPLTKWLEQLGATHNCAVKAVKERAK